MSLTPLDLAARVKTTGRRLGFDRVAIGPAEPPAHGAAFEAWLDAGYAGTMGYLERGRAKAARPSAGAAGGAVDRDGRPQLLPGPRGRRAGPRLPLRLGRGLPRGDGAATPGAARRSDRRRARDGRPRSTSTRVPSSSARSRPGPAWAGWARTRCCSTRRSARYFFIGVRPDDGGAVARCAGRGPLRHLHALPGRVPDAGVRRRRTSLDARRCISLPDDRAPGADSRGAPGGDGRVDLRLRRLPVRSARGTGGRRSRPRPGSPPATFRPSPSWPRLRVEERSGRGFPAVR